jgi:hypothetical protein
MKRFVLFEFDEETRISFTRVIRDTESGLYGSDGFGSKLFLFEFEYNDKGRYGYPEKVVISNYFEIYDYNLAGIIERLNKLYEFQIEQVEFSHDNGYGNLTLRLTDNKRVDITFTNNDLINRLSCGVTFRIQADQTIIQRLIEVLKK